MSFPSSHARLRAPSFYQALPAYLGGKRRLAPLIFAQLAEVLPRAEWPGSTFLDPFCGGGAVALTAKALGFDVVASDLAARGAVTARALVENSTVRQNELDVLGLFSPPGVDYPRSAASYVPAVFSEPQADWIDRAMAAVRGRSEPGRSLLLVTIIKVILSLQPMSVLDATDAVAAGSGDFDRISAQRLRHYLQADRALEPKRVWAVAQQVNRGVFAGRGRALQGDARRILAETAGDVVYLDPPYADTTGYAHTYAPLDALLEDELLPAGQPPSLDELLGHAAHVPLLVLSYGGPQHSLESLSALVSRHRPVLSALAIPYPHLRAIASEEKNRANHEYLIIAGR